MSIPDYWLPRPRVSWSVELHSQIEDLWEVSNQQSVISSQIRWIADELMCPKWMFLCWLTDVKGLLLHGSDNPEINEFQPRSPNDRSADEFSKQTAVFAASDGIWAMFYAIIARKRYPLTMLNAALQFEIAAGSFSQMYYLFSVTEEILKLHPWRKGFVYVLPRDGFQQQPIYELAGRRVLEPHWASNQPVKPLAKLKVSPSDFPYLDKVRGHKDDYIREAAAKDPFGFPWL